MVFNTDDRRFGGCGRLTSSQHHDTMAYGDTTLNNRLVRLYLPNRCAMILSEVFDQT